MSAWRVEQHYGFGAAQIPIRAEAHRAPPMGLAEGMASLVAEMTEGGPLATLRRLAGQMPALALGVLILGAFILTLSQDHADLSPVEVVLFESEPPPLPPIVEEPVSPEPAPKPPESPPLEIAKPEPPRPVVPRPPPPRLAERPKPPPPPKVAPKPRPRPVVPRIARLEAPPPPAAPKRIERPVRERAQPVSRPRVAIEAARPEPLVASVSPPPERTGRAVAPRVQPRRSTPRLDAPAAPAADVPDEPAPSRAFRVAAARPAPGERPRALPGLSPAPRVTESPPRDRAPVRVAHRRPDTSRDRSRQPAPGLDAAPVPVTPASPVPVPRRATRRPPAPTSGRARPRPAAEVARVAVDVPSSAPELASRAGRAAPDAPRGVPSERPGVAGVPLGDLAACVSDREEDRLKQAVVAAVTTQKECVSRKGTYRFVETKNLNAFLMWIDRAPGRPVSDRCVELGYALECLRSTARRAAR